jgi:hypothetical protein
MAHKIIRAREVTPYNAKAMLNNIMEKCGEPLAGEIPDRGIMARAFYDFNNTGLIVDAHGFEFYGAFIAGRIDDVNDTVKNLGLEKYVVGGSE